MDGWDVDCFGSILVWVSESQESRGVTGIEGNCSIYFLFHEIKKRSDLDKGLVRSRNKEVLVLRSESIAKSEGGQ